MLFSWDGAFGLALSDPTIRLEILLPLEEHAIACFRFPSRLQDNGGQNLVSCMKLVVILFSLCSAVRSPLLIVSVKLLIPIDRD
jgi:hypothetical protein